MENKHILSFKDVSFSYEPGSSAVMHDVSFSLKPGTFTVIVGPSGAGKSTLLRLITGLEHVASGSIENNSRTRMIFQDGALLPWRNVHDNVHLGFTGTPGSHRDHHKRIHDELANLGLADFAKSYPRDLSGGQRQRVGIARALVADPELLLLDEPFSALDVETIERLSEELLQIFSSRGMTMLMVSHDLEDSVLLADEILVFEHGTIAHKIPVTIERPRRRDDPHVEKIVHEVKNLIAHT